MKNLHRENVKVVFLLLIVTGVLLVMSWYAISTLTFFTTDTGLRYIQIENLLENGMRDFAIEYPARHLDPDFRHVPYYRAYTVVDGQMYLSLTPYFNLMAAWFYAWLGVLGLSVVPVLGTVFSGLMVYELVRLSDLPYAKTAFLLTIFATPMVFYSLELWDHSLGVALMMGSVYGVARGLVKEQPGWLLLGGIALGLSLGQRAEAYMFAVALGLSLLIVTRGNIPQVALVVGGAVLGVIPIWVSQYIWYQHPLGPVTAKHLLGYGKLDYIAVNTLQEEPDPFLYKRLAFLTYMSEPFSRSILVTIPIVIGQLGFAAVLLVERLRRGTLLIASVGIALIGYEIFALNGLIEQVTGLLPTAPLFALGLIYQRQFQTEARKTVHDLCWYVMVLFVGLMLIIWPAVGGWQWGTRYVLTFYPLLIYCALQRYYHFSQRFEMPFLRVFQLSVLFLVGLSIFIQAIGVRLLYQVHYSQIPVLEAIDNLPVDVILTDKILLPSRMAASDKTFVYFPEWREKEIVVDRLQAQGIEQVAIIDSQDFPAVLLSDFIFLQADEIQFPLETIPPPD